VTKMSEEKAVLIATYPSLTNIQSPILIFT
jgi:hypothetical protein